MENYNIKRLFVDYLFNYIERNFNYLILRNYENLPEDEGHDIDLLIHKKETPKIEQFLELILEIFPIKIYKNYRYPNLLSHLIVFENEILHLDFFTNVQWNKIDLFETFYLLNRKIRFKYRYWIMNPNDFQKYCWFLYIIRKGNLKKEKYIKNAKYWICNIAFENIGIDIDKGLIVKNKVLLFLYFWKKSPIKVISGTFKNILFKINKLSHPYGRIFYPIMNQEIADTCIQFCFIGSKFFVCSKTDLLSIIKAYVALTKEQGVIVSDPFLKKNRLFHVLLQKYFVRTTNDLQESINHILKKYEI